MPKDVLLYGHVGEYSATRFFESINKALEEDEKAELNFRINTEGGSPDFMIGILNKLREIGATKGIVDGMAYSSGAYACCLLDEVEAVESAKFVFHRAAYPEWFEANKEYFTDTHQKILASTNKSLEKAMREKMDIAKFEKITKVTLEEIFAMTGQVDAVLTAAQAKSVGLIDKIVKLTPRKKKEIEAYVEVVEDQAFKIAAKKFLKIEAEVDDDDDEEQTTKPTPKNSNSMTSEEFKLKHPEAYAAIVKAAVEGERDRAGAWLQYYKIDAKEAIAGALGDKPLSQTKQAEFSVLAMSNGRLKDIADDSQGTVKTGGTEQPGELTEKQKEVAAFEAKVDAVLGRPAKKAVAA